MDPVACRRRQTTFHPSVSPPLRSNRRDVNDLRRASDGIKFSDDDDRISSSSTCPSLLAGTQTPSCSWDSPVFEGSWETAGRWSSGATGRPPVPSVGGGAGRLDDISPSKSPDRDEFSWLPPLELPPPALTDTPLGYRSDDDFDYLLPEAKPPTREEKVRLIEAARARAIGPQTLESSKQAPCSGQAPRQNIFHGYATFLPFVIAPATYHGSTLYTPNRTLWIPTGTFRKSSVWRECEYIVPGLFVMGYAAIRL